MVADSVFFGDEVGMIGKYQYAAVIQELGTLLIFEKPEN